MEEINLDHILRRIAEDFESIKNVDFVKFNGRIVSKNQASEIIQQKCSELLDEAGLEQED